MNKILSYKTNQFFFILIKLGIVVGAFYFIYNKLVNNEALNFHDFIRSLSNNNVFTLKNAFILLLLTTLNWFFEILKWQTLVSYIKKISFITALKQSLSSLTASLFTPNRIGEYGAKALYYHKPYRKRILLLNLISNSLQMAITVILGCIGFWVFTETYTVNINYLKLMRIIIVLIVVFVGCFIVIKQNKYKVKGLLLKKIIDFVLKLPSKIKSLTFLFSLIRYAIFSFQFYFLLQLFGTELNYLEALSIITSMYLLASIIPSIFILDVIVKGGVAVYLFSMAGVNEITILCIITLMWFLNFVLPSVIGSYYVLRFNHLKLES